MGAGRGGGISGITTLRLPSGRTADLHVRRRLWRAWTAPVTGFARLGLAPPALGGLRLPRLSGLPDPSARVVPSPLRPTLLSAATAVNHLPPSLEISGSPLRSVARRSRLPCSTSPPQTSDPTKSTPTSWSRRRRARLEAGSLLDQTGARVAGILRRAIADERFRAKPGQTLVAHVAAVRRAARRAGRSWRAPGSRGPALRLAAGSAARLPPASARAASRSPGRSRARAGDARAASRRRGRAARQLPLRQIPDRRTQRQRTTDDLRPAPARVSRRRLRAALARARVDGARRRARARSRQRARRLR